MSNYQAMVEGEVQALKDALSKAHLREAGDDTKLKEEADLRMVVFNEKTALQAEHASLLAKMEQVIIPVGLTTSTILILFLFSLLVQIGERLAMYTGI
jgi:hypothetical protein